MNSKFAQQFKKGALEMVLLEIISRGETYGYEIISQLNGQGGRVFAPARDGTIYPLLYRLESNGLISRRSVFSVASGNAKKYYSLTEQGEKALGEMKAYWQEYVKSVNSFVAESGE